MSSSVMNAEISAQHLEQILLALPDVPILLLWDRAPWHFGQPIRDILEANSRLEILHLPTAAPDLNPQEQIWKDTRCAVSHNHLRTNLSDLAQRFEQHLKSNTFVNSFLDDYGFNDICSMFK